MMFSRSPARTRTMARAVAQSVRRSVRPTIAWPMYDISYNNITIILIK